MELFTTADGIMGVFTKTIDKLEKLKSKKVVESEQLTAEIGKLKGDRAKASGEVNKAAGYIDGIKNMMNNGGN